MSDLENVVDVEATAVAEQTAEVVETPEEGAEEVVEGAE